MAVLFGEHIEHYEYAGYTGNLDNQQPITQPPGDDRIIEDASSFIDEALFSRAVNVDVPAKRVLNVDPFMQYYEDYYNRIIITPGQLDFETVSATKTQVFYVWNAYKYAAQTLQSITEENFQGISLAGSIPPPDTVFQPLEERTYVVEITTDGAPDIDATAQFNWLGALANDPVSIIGTRIIIYPYLYRPGMVETLEWYTKVMTSFNGKETRSRGRTAPRQSMAVTSYIKPSEHARADNMLYGGRHLQWGNGLWGEARKLTAAVTTGDATIYVDTAFGDFKVGGVVLIYTDERTFDSGQVTAMDASSVSFDKPVLNDFSTEAFVMPVRKSWVKKEPKRSTSGYNAVIKMLFDGNDNTALVSTPSDTQYLGEDVYLERPLKVGGKYLNDTYKRDIKLLDFKTGVVDLISDWETTKIGREFLVSCEGLEEIWNFRTWLHRRAGKHRPFYMPTFENNMRPTGTGPILSSFYIQDDANYLLASSRNNIYIQMKDGSFQIVGIDNITVVGNELLVDIDTNLTENLEDIDFISYIRLKRLARDRIQLKWLQNFVVECKVAIVEVD